VDRGFERPTDAAHRLQPLDQPSVLETTHQDVETFGLVAEQLGALAGGRLHHDDPSHVLPGVVGMLHETVHEGPQETAGAELEDRFDLGGRCHVRASWTLPGSGSLLPSRPSM
jgi:hypothetical protein